MENVALPALGIHTEGLSAAVLWPAELGTVVHKAVSMETGIQMMLGL